MKSEQMVNQPTRKSAVALHKLYNMEKVNVPSVKDIIIKRIRIAKHFDEFLGGLDEYEVNEDMMQEHIELCGLLGLDYDSIAPYDMRTNNIIR